MIIKTCQNMLLKPFLKCFCVNIVQLFKNIIELFYNYRFLVLKLKIHDIFFDLFSSSQNEDQEES